MDDLNFEGLIKPIARAFCGFSLLVDLDDNRRAAILGVRTEEDRLHPDAVVAYLPLSFAYDETMIS